VGTAGDLPPNIIILCWMGDSHWAIGLLSLGFYRRFRWKWA